MAFLDVNRKKLAFLLNRGTHTGELRKFFVESRVPLIHKGARGVQNLPQGNTERIRAICERLPPKTNDTLRDWFQKNITLSDPMPPADVLTYLELYDQNESLSATEMQLVARSALIYLFEETPDRELLSFLRRAPGAPPTPHDSVASNLVPVDTEPQQNEMVSQEDEPISETLTPQSYQLSELIAALIANDKSAIDNALEAFSTATQTLVEALLYIRGGNIEAAGKQLELLDPSGPEVELIRNALGRVRHQRGAPSSSSGIQLYIPQQLMEHPKADSHTIIGICTNISEAGAVFVRPLALKLDKQFHLLGQDDRAALFPESGDVMTYRSELRLPLKPRDLIHWRVAEKENTSGKIRFHMESELGPVFETRRISVPSTDPDKVRERIKTLAASEHLSTNQQMIFLLSDGIAVASFKAVDLSRDEAYDQAWQAWSSLETWLIEGRECCLDLSKHPASHLDLSTLDTAFKKILKNLEAEQKVTLSKAQKRELIDLLRDASTGEHGFRVQRAVSVLEHVVLDGDDLETVLDLLKAREEVRLRVQQLIDAEHAQWRSEHSGLQAEIEVLKHKKTELVKEGKEQERQNKKLADAAASMVKDAFSKAIHDGMTTLANAEIFRMLTDNHTHRVVEPSVPVPAVTTLIESWAIKETLPPSEVKTRLMALGLNARQAIVLAELCALTLDSGALLILKGNCARQYAQVLIRMNCETSGMLAIPMGLTSGAPIRHALDALPDVQNLAILDADLSPLEVYGARLLDSVFEAAQEKENNPPPLLLSCLGGDMSLPLPEVVRQIAVVVDMDLSWDNGLHSLAEVEIESSSLLPSFRSKLLQRLAEVQGEYQDHVERALVKALIP